jgi:ribonuclease VapC
MVIDTSALIAILSLEPEAARLAQAIEADATRLISAATLLEAGIVMEARLGSAGGTELDLLVAKAGLVIEPVTADQSAIAREAWRRFGKGRHMAGLNFGDCCSYALARITGEPLLFKGADFANTDIAAVRY